MATTVLVAASFPYSPPILGSSTQPVATALAALFLLAVVVMKAVGGRLWCDRHSLLLFGLVCLAGVVQFSKPNELEQTFNYFSKYVASAILIWFGHFWLFDQKSRIVLSVVAVWVLAAIVQLFSPEAFLGFVSNQDIARGRGLPSLAPEPSHFSIHLSLLFLLSYRLWMMRMITRRSLTLTVGLVISGQVMSASGTAFISIFLMLAVLIHDKRLIWSRKVRTLFVCSVFMGLILVICLLTLYYPESRSGDLLGKALSGSLVLDRSLMTRFYYLLVGLWSLLGGPFLGFSLGAFQANGLDIFDSVPTVVAQSAALSDLNSNGKVHSLFSTFALDFGKMAGAVLIVAIYRIYHLAADSYSGGLVGRVALLSLIVFLSVLPIPVGSPLYFAVIGFYLSNPTRG